jgi:hypothetical protein
VSGNTRLLLVLCSAVTLGCVRFEVLGEGEGLLLALMRHSSECLLSCTVRMFLH